MDNLLSISALRLRLCWATMIACYLFSLLNAMAQIKKDTTSYIQTLDIKTGKIDTILAVKSHFEAPNWHPDNYLVLNSKRKIYTLNLASKKVAELNTGLATACNNDHGIWPDKKWLVVSHNDKSDPSGKGYKSALYVLPITGGEPRRVTPEVPSFWQGLDDGPDYSADGNYIYFNSYRTGHMQIWRMGADGSKPEQLISDENSNWFAHPSPDNNWIVYIAYMSDEKQADLFGKQVKLRLMNPRTKAIKDLTPVFYGGQSIINVPS